MVPRTSDRRVLFAIPWHEHTLVGTTDTPVAEPSLEPVPMEQEIEFILETAAHYLTRKPAWGDILSAFAGIRPLVRGDDSSNTAALSRDHTIRIENSGMITVCGGKWTTYRRMAEDAVNQAATLACLPERECVTRQLKIHGAQASFVQTGKARSEWFSVYGSDRTGIERLIEKDPSLQKRVHPALPYIAAEVVWAVREEMARTVEDVLARRTRALFLNAQAAREMAPAVTDLIMRELNRDENWRESHVRAFEATARNYSTPTIRQ
jgi:glycerol-3-phosphate dehydrogenase